MNISESDLMIYILAVEKKYYELMELYGLLHEHSKCKKCGFDNGLHYKIVKEVIDSFGSHRKGIRVPDQELIKRVSREITIWKGLSRCSQGDNSLALKAEEYAQRYDLTLDNVYKIRNRLQKIVEKFVTLKNIFNGAKDEEDS